VAKLTQYEQETIIGFNEAEATANVYTHNKKLRDKLARLALQYPDTIRLVRGEPHGAVTYTVPKACVSVRVPYSDERRATDSKRAKSAGIRPPGRSVCPKIG
jgi:hypothetical protein